MHEEVANSITHGLGLLLSLVASVLLISAAGHSGDTWQMIGCATFAVSMVAVYAASTLSHAFADGQVRRFFRILDQAFIYVMIAGTYTPFALTYLRGGWWWVLFGMMWGIALAGVFAKVVRKHEVDGATVWSYVLMGWLPMLAVKPLLTTVPLGGLWWMLMGGLCYTAGSVFLTFDKHIRYFHAVWHVLVIAGSGCHFFAILWYVAEQRFV